MSAPSSRPRRRATAAPLKPLVTSYVAEDCSFLLRPMAVEFTSIEDKEWLIQTGRAHYSEMVHREAPPAAAYLELFFAMTARYGARMAAEVMRLATEIAERRDGPVTLLSLLRAGTPIGVLLRRALAGPLGREVRHYSISIIRDRGIDEAALDWLLAGGITDRSMVFVDGWTAKGVIGDELRAALARYNASRGVEVSDELFVLADVGGCAEVAATADDYAVPNALLNATVSGLVSRSVLEAQPPAGLFHGCVVYDDLAEHDRSRWFVDEVSRHLSPAHVAPPLVLPREPRQEAVAGFLARVREAHGAHDRNRIKPGIAEATRVMLRRVPDLLLLKDRESADVEHLLELAKDKRVAVEIDAAMPFGACALIRDTVNAPQRT